MWAFAILNCFNADVSIPLASDIGLTSGEMIANYKEEGGGGVLKLDNNEIYHRKAIKFDKLLIDFEKIV